MKIDGFDWDEGNLEKCQKHGVSVEVIEALFASARLYVAPDPSVAEHRFRAIGVTEDRRGVFLVVTMREREEQRLVRPISARYMHQKELQYYEKEISDFPK